MMTFVYVFVRLFRVFRPTQEFFTRKDVTMTDEGLRILTYAWHLWPLISDGSLAVLYGHLRSPVTHQMPSV